MNWLIVYITLYILLYFCKKIRKCYIYIESRLLGLILYWISSLDLILLKFSLFFIPFIPLWPSHLHFNVSIQRDFFVNQEWLISHQRMPKILASFITFLIFSLQTNFSYNFFLTHIFLRAYFTTRFSLCFIFIKCQWGKLIKKKIMKGVKTAKL